MRIRLLLLFCLLGINNIVYAEGGCPLGTYPANLPATNICNPFPGNENNGQPQQPQGRWETRWGTARDIQDLRQMCGFKLSIPKRHFYLLHLVKTFASSTLLPTVTGK